MFPSYSVGRTFVFQGEGTVMPGREQTRLAATGSAAAPRVQMPLLPEAPVRVGGDLRLPQRPAPVPPLQARDRRGVCGGVELAGEQRRRPDDPRQVSRAVHTAVAHVAACGERPRNLVTSQLCSAAACSHTGPPLRRSE